MIAFALDYAAIAFTYRYNHSTKFFIYIDV